MRFNKKKVLALTGAIANLSFTCAVAGVATYAWFTSIESATSDGMTIISSLEHIRLDYVILKYDDNLKEGIATGVNDASEFILPEYDQYIKERNKYSNLIVRANLVFPDPIDTSETEIKIDITKAVESSLKALDEGDPNDPNDDALLIQKLTSNVVQFKSIVTSYTLADGENTVVPINIGIQETQGGYASVYDAEYKTAVDYFKSRNTPTTFISLMNNQPVDPMNGNVITLAGNDQVPSVVHFLFAGAVLGTEIRSVPGFFIPAGKQDRPRLQPQTGMAVQIDRAAFVDARRKKHFAAGIDRPLDRCRIRSQTVAYRTEIPDIPHLHSSFLFSAGPFRQRTGHLKPDGNGYMAGGRIIDQRQDQFTQPPGKFIGIRDQKIEIVRVRIRIIRFQQFTARPESDDLEITSADQTVFGQHVIQS